jgi:phosphotransferase system HPr-like phosphotransfer protein
MTDKTIFAVTHNAAGADEQVAYANLSEHDGRATLTVRSGGEISFCHECKNAKPFSARIELTRLELAAIAKSILAHLGAGADLRAQLQLRLDELFPDNAAVVDVTPKPRDENDFPLGQACDLSGEGTCEACQ